MSGQINVVPAHAGVIPNQRKGLWSKDCSPRTCGGDPPHTLIGGRNDSSPRICRVNFIKMEVVKVISNEKRKKGEKRL